MVWQESLYAYDSIMHYNRHAFAREPQTTTIVARDEQFQDVMGQRLELSPIDIILVEKLYSQPAKFVFGYSNKEGNDLILVFFLFKFRLKLFSFPRICFFIIQLTELNLCCQVVASYTDLRGRDRRAPSRGFAYIQPGSNLPFLFASNYSTFGLHVQSISGNLIVGDPASTNNLVKCLDHPPLGNICFEQRQLAEKNPLGSVHLTDLDISL